MVERRRRCRNVTQTVAIGAQQQEMQSNEPTVKVQRRRRYQEPIGETLFSYETVQATKIFPWTPIQVRETSYICEEQEEHFPPKHQQEDWENGYPIRSY